MEAKQSTSLNTAPRPSANICEFARGGGSGAERGSRGRGPLPRHFATDHHGPARPAAAVGTEPPTSQWRRAAHRVPGARVYEVGPVAKGEKLVAYAARPRRKLRPAGTGAPSGEHVIGRGLGRGSGAEAGRERTGAAVTSLGSGGEPDRRPLAGTSQGQGALAQRHTGGGLPRPHSFQAVVLFLRCAVAPFGEVRFGPLGCGDGQQGRLAVTAGAGKHA